MKFKPTDKFFIVKSGKIHQAVVIEVTETIGLPTKVGSSNYEKERRVHYAILETKIDGKALFTSYFLSKNDVIFSSYLKAVRFLKENVVYLQASDVQDFINQERERDELPF